MSWAYGQYEYFCRQIPSVATCNLFYRQLLDNGSVDIQDPEIAGVGIRSSCAIPNLSNSGPRLGNIADIILAGLSVFVAIFIAFQAWRRIAAVGRVEFSLLSLWYGLSAALQVFTEGSFLEQGTKTLVWLTAVHHGVVASLCVSTVY